VQSAGNAAGTGARIALLNQQARDEIERVIKKVEKIETAVEPKFQAHFVEAMGIPHSTAATPNLAEAVKLPARKISGANNETATAGERRRRRRRAEVKG
jgi:uncharacterized 2Fe-2S/4Fe-4S cluster protein (DUF4445 family)